MNEQETIEKIARDMRPTRAAICELLQMTELQYGQMQYDEGLNYLRTYIPSDEWGQDILLRSRIFWQWWINHWELRDRCFIHISKIEMKTLCIMREVYAQSHDGRALAKNIHPNGVVMDASYAEMIGRLVDEA